MSRFEEGLLEIVRKRGTESIYHWNGKEPRSYWGTQWLSAEAIPIQAPLDVRVADGANEFHLVIIAGEVQRRWKRKSRRRPQRHITKGFMAPGP